VPGVPPLDELVLDDEPPLDVPPLDEELPLEEPPLDDDPPLDAPPLDAPPLEVPPLEVPPFDPSGVPPPVPSPLAPHARPAADSITSNPNPHDRTRIFVSSVPHPLFFRGTKVSLWSWPSARKIVEGARTILGRGRHLAKARAGASDDRSTHRIACPSSAQVERTLASSTITRSWAQLRSSASLRSTGEPTGRRFDEHAVDIVTSERVTRT
jgi:hypothetical protein